jgi:hypothetical protein
MYRGEKSGGSVFCKVDGVAYLPLNENKAVLAEQKKLDPEIEVFFSD